MAFTYEDLLNIECCVQSAIYDFDNKICELKSGTLTDNYKREQLALRTKARDDYSELYRKLKQMEREIDNEKKTLY